MENADIWKAHVRALIYPIQFEKNPLDGMDRVLEQVVKAGALGATPQEFLSSVRTALTSQIDLARLIPQDHSELTIRIFLAEVERRLQDDTKKPQTEELVTL